MVGRTNAGIGGGNAYAWIAVTYPAGATCTATNGVKTLTAKDTCGKFVFNIPNAGVFPQNWTVSESTNNNSKTVSVSGEHAWVAVDLVDTYEKLAADIAQTDFARLSIDYNDEIKWGGNTRKLTRNTSEPVILMYGNNNGAASINGAAISLYPIFSCMPGGSNATRPTAYEKYTANGTRYYAYATASGNNASTPYSININGITSLSSTSLSDITNNGYINTASGSEGELGGSRVSDIESWIDRLALLPAEESTVLYNGESSNDIFMINPSAPVTVASKYDGKKQGFEIVDASATMGINVAYSVNKIDLSGYSKFRVTHTDSINGSLSTAFAIYVNSSVSVSSPIAVATQAIQTIKQAIDIDISNINEEEYLLIKTAGSSNSSYIQKIELIK